MTIKCSFNDCLSTSCNLFHATGEGEGRAFTLCFWLCRTALREKPEGKKTEAGACHSFSFSFSASPAAEGLLMPAGGWAGSPLHRLEKDQQWPKGSLTRA